MTPDYSPFRHLNDIGGGEEIEGLFVDGKTGEPILIRAQGDYWMNPFVLRFVPIKDLKHEGYQDYLELFHREQPHLKNSENEAGAPGY